MKLKICTIICAVFLVITGTVFAGDNCDVCTVTQDFSEGIITVSGACKPNSRLFISVYPMGISSESLLNNIEAEKVENVEAQGKKSDGETVKIPTKIADITGKLVFYDELKTDEAGKWNADIMLSDSGSYDIYVACAGERHSHKNISFTGATEYSGFIKELNDKLNDKDAFIHLVQNDGVAKLGADATLSEKADIKKTAEILFDTLNNKSLSAGNYEENKMLTECCMAIALLNDGICEDTAKYLGYALNDDKTSLKWYENYIKSEDDEKALVERLQGNLTSVDSLKTEMEKALVLYVVENPDGYENIYDLFNDFKEITGISSPKSNLNIYKSLAGMNFENINKLVRKYEELSKTPPSNGGGGGSSSGGGSAGGAVVGSKTPSDDNNASSGIAQPMNKDIFSDIESVSWAREAIVELTAKGVLSGKGDNRFCPDDMVTREEFTKMIVAAFAQDEAEQEIGFLDVPNGRWSYPYIAKAKNAGLINGYSDTLFGATDLISRQDMALIVYNCAVYKEVEIPAEVEYLEFSDDAEISDYAKQAVYSLKVMDIINGVSDIEFAPKSNATRAQAAVIIYKLLNK